MKEKSRDHILCSNIHHRDDDKTPDKKPGKGDIRISCAGKDGGIMTMGMTIRSWKMRIPSVALPCGLSTSIRSASTFITMAVDDKETSIPRRRHGQDPSR